MVNHLAVNLTSGAVDLIGTGRLFLFVISDMRMSLITCCVSFFQFDTLQPFSFLIENIQFHLVFPVCEKYSHKNIKK